MGLKIAILTSEYVYDIMPKFEQWQKDNPEAAVTDVQLVAENGGAHLVVMYKLFDRDELIERLGLKPQPEVSEPSFIDMQTVPVEGETDATEEEVG